MRNALKALLVVTAGMSLTGCMSGFPSAAGARPGGIVADGTYGSGGLPAYMRLQRDDVEILGQVQSVSESDSVLGIISQGDNGYGKVLAAARAKYPETDAVINMQWDIQYKAICGGFLYEKVISKIDGTAVKYKKDKK